MPDRMVVGLRKSPLVAQSMFMHGEGFSIHRTLCDQVCKWLFGMSVGFSW